VSTHNDFTQQTNPNTIQKKSKIKKKPTKKRQPNYDWITILLVPLFAAMDARTKLAEDATIPPSPPLDTSVLEKSYFFT